MSSDCSAPVNSSFAPSTWDCTRELGLTWVQSLDNKFDAFLWRLKRRDLTSSSQWALATADLFKSYLTTAAEQENKTTVSQIITLFREMARVLITARPVELVVGNIIRRVLHSIRQEAILLTVYQDKPRPAGVDVADTTHPLLNPVFAGNEQYKDVVLKDIVGPITDTLEELVEDVKGTDKNVSKSAVAHIFPNEVILTYGFSRTLLAFLQTARHHRTFEVYVAETAPSLSGRRFAKMLSEHNISVTLIPDSDIFTIMPVVTKVFIGSHAVLANGGVLAMVGANNLALAAAHNQVPVVVLCGLHKISPQYAFDQETYNEYNSPAQVLQFDDCLEGRIDVINPAFDYVTPDSIQLFITDNGAHPPQCIYRNLSELYSSEDYSLVE